VRSGSAIAIKIDLVAEGHPAFDLFELTFEPGSALNQRKMRLKETKSRPPASAMCPRTRSAQRRAQAEFGFPVTNSRRPDVTAERGRLSRGRWLSPALAVVSITLSGGRVSMPVLLPVGVTPSRA
jgi:hypothetical protein